MNKEVKCISSVVKEFTRFAHQYDDYNVIQSKVAKTLVAKLPCNYYKTVVDIGCGSGSVYKNFLNQAIKVDNFFALDSSQRMLDIHPSSDRIHKVCSNFNDENFLDLLSCHHFDLLVSSSSLQWSTNLRSTMDTLSVLSPLFYASIFTSGTFKTLHDIAGVVSPIYDTKTLKEILEEYYTEVVFEVRHYHLAFKSTRDMLKYIKQSGVSSGERKLSYLQTKDLMKRYPLNYLEFEVLFVEAKK